MWNPSKYAHHFDHIVCSWEKSLNLIFQYYVPYISKKKEKEKKKKRRRIQNYKIYIYIYIERERERERERCLSYIGYVCLVSAVYNSSLQLQKLDHFVVVLWLCNIL